MRLLGVPALLVALVLIVYNKPLATWQNEGDQRRTHGHFAGGGWRQWNRVVFYVVGAAFAAWGVAVLFGAPLA